MDFEKLQKEFLEKKILVLKSTGIQRNTTWKKFDISQYNIPEKEFWFRILKPDYKCQCKFCGKDINFETCHISTSKDLFCTKKECYQYALETRKKTNIEKYGEEYVLNNKEKKEKVKNSWKEKTDKSYITKRKNTLIQKYGSIENFYKERQEKTKKTNIEKYGFSMPSKNECIKQKIQNSFKKKSIAELEKIKNKIKQTNIEKYGVDCIFKDKECRKKIKEKIDQDRKEFAEKNDLIQCSDFWFGNGWILSHLVDRIIYKGASFIKKSDLCKIKEYYNININHGLSHTETELQDFIKNIYSGKIIFNNRSILDGKELDIYIPDKKIAIEYNGIFWHSSVYKNKNYHKEKTEICNKKNIRLIHIFEDEWQHKKEIIKSIIKSSIGIYDKKIFARKCIINEIDSKTYKNFLDKNHIQGSINSSVRLGLFYNKKLVQVIGLGKSRFKKNEFELQRMCSLLNTQIIGGFSKLCSKINFPFISYIDLSKFSGDSYKKSEFEFLYKTPPSYSYFYKDSLKRFNRINFQKSKLKTFQNYSKDKTEQEIMYENGFLQVFDCGTLKVKYNGNKNKIN